GWISLTDYPPYGPATVAGDGQATPVLSINTVLATARLDELIAHAINDSTMIQLADQDYRNAQAAETQLVAVLNSACQPGGSDQAIDVYGNKVTPYDDAQAVYSSNNVSMSNGGQTVDNSFQVSLGWLQNGSTTVTAVPQPSAM